MIIESAILNVKRGQEDAFEAAMAKARPLIAATPGFLGIQLHPCIDAEGRYLLLVQWNSVTDHTVGFRQSERYEAWRALLHHFYDPFPAVEHYEARSIV